MADYTITLSEADELALTSVATSVQEWIQNATNGRAAKAKKDILPRLIEHCNANEIALAVGEAAQIQQAFDLGVVVDANSIGTQPLQVGGE
jgi:hypothetical protein